MEQGENPGGERDEPQEVGVPACRKVQNRQVLHRRARQIEEVRVIRGERAIYVEHHEREREQNPDVFAEGAHAPEPCPPGENQVQREPQQSRVVHEALVCVGRREIRAVCGDQDGADAAERPHDGDEVDQYLPRAAVPPERQIQHDENHQAAQVKRQAQRIEVHPARGALDHVAEHLAHLAEGADRRHHHARAPQAPLFPHAAKAQRGDHHRAQADPEQMLHCKHIASPVLSLHQQLQGLSDVPDGQQLHVRRAADLPRVVCRDDALRKAQPLRLGQALLQMADRPDLAREAYLPHRGHRLGDGFVEIARGDGHDRREIRRRLVERQAADDVEVRVALADLQPAALFEHRQQHRRAVIVEAVAAAQGL